MYYFTYQDKTAFIPLKAVYPECYVLRQDHPTTNPLQCLTVGDCPGNRQCMNTLAHRVHYLFDKVVLDSELILLYFKDHKGSIKAGIFYRDMSEPRVITCNRSAFDKFMTGGVVQEWTPPDEFFLIQSVNDLIVPESLVRGND